MFGGTVRLPKPDFVTVGDQHQLTADLPEGMSRRVDVDVEPACSHRGRELTERRAACKGRDVLVGQDGTGMAPPAGREPRGSAGPGD